jgi:hypothetical protein
LRRSVRRTAAGFGAWWAHADVGCPGTVRGLIGCEGTVLEREVTRPTVHLAGLKTAPAPCLLRFHGDMESKADQYQRKADEAEEHARSCLDVEAQRAWLEAAQLWREMAEKERSGGPEPRPDKAV